MELPIEKIETAPLDFCEAYQKFSTAKKHALTQAQTKLNNAKSEINEMVNLTIKNLDLLRQGELKKLELLQGTDLLNISFFIF